MPRPLRVEYEGAVYHVMSRGDRREAIFRDDEDRRRFLETLGEGCGKTDWVVHALCLMPNHFHLVLETPGGNLVAGMRWLMGTYTMRFNRRHRLTGHLFGGRYKALVIDAESPGYFGTVCDYVHLNPARAGLVGREEPLRSYPWSSFPQYLMRPRQRWPWLRVDRLLADLRLPGDTGAARREVERHTEGRRGDAEEDPAWRKIRRGWFLGDRKLKRELMEEALAGLRPGHLGEIRSEGEETKADRLVDEGLEKLGWGRGELKRRLKGDPGKVKLAARLRSETTLTMASIAERLEMGSGSYVANLLRSVESGG